VLVETILFLVCFIAVLKAASYAIRFSTKLAMLFGVSDFVISFFVVAVVSAMPETVISLLANVEGKPATAVMTLLASNVVDLTLIFGVIALVTGKVKVESKLLRIDTIYLALLALPLLLGIDGAISRAEGIVLLLAGLAFFYTVFVQKPLERKHIPKHHGTIIRTAALLVGSILVLIVAAHYTISYAGTIARMLHIPEFVIALLIISIGTCLPEFIYSLQAIISKHEQLALGDILGTVIIDATIILGIVAIVRPISVDPMLFRVTAFFNALSACVLIYYIRMNKELNRGHGIVLVFFYFVFIIVELFLL
jgi:cation:H+ antiporter